MLRSKLRNPTDFFNLPLLEQKSKLFPGAECENCPLNEQPYARGDIVGTKPPRIAVIGESPGNDEITNRICYQGDSGKILRGAIDYLGLGKYGVLLNNTVPCNCDGLWDAKETLAAQAFEFCESRLVKLYEENPIEVTVVMGAVAKTALFPELKRRAISKLAGSWWSLTKTRSEKHHTFGYCVFLVHPAAMLHSSEGDKALGLWIDNLNEARLHFEEQPLEVKVVHVDTPSKLQDMMDAVQDDVLYVDLETSSLSPWDTGKGILSDGSTFDYGDILEVSVTAPSLPDTSFVCDWSVVADCDKFGDWLQSRKLRGHNISFDLAFLGKHLNRRFVIDGDSLLKSYSLEESPWHGLKRLGRRHLGVEDWSADLKPYTEGSSDGSYARIPKEKRIPYAGKDTVIAMGVDDRLSASMDGNSRRIYEDFLIPMANDLLDVRMRGTMIDFEALASSIDLFDSKISEHKKVCAEFGVTNPNATKQVASGLEYAGAPYVEGTGIEYLEKYVLSETAELEADSVARDLSVFARNVLGYRTAFKSKNTYLRDIARSVSLEDGCVHPFFKLWATVTGRIVIDDPTLTNYSKATRYAQDIRRCFRPRPGYVWLHADFGQFELRVYAVVAGDSNMRGIFQDGKDPHEMAGLYVYGDEYYRMNEETNGRTRIVIKGINFGRIYGRQPRSISYELGIDEEEAADLCRTLDKFWPDLPTYHKMIRKYLNEHGEVTNPFGRTRRFPLITRSTKQRCFNQAANFLIQSTASDINLLVVHEVLKRFDPEDVFPLFTVHDSIEFEINASKADVLVPQVIEIMERVPQEVLKTDMPFVADKEEAECWTAK